ncbi:MAG: hypothetical protein WCI57_02195 [Candidatus Berkelbacteria bacterium]
MSDEPNTTSSNSPVSDPDDFSQFEMSMPSAFPDADDIPVVSATAEQYVSSVYDEKDLMKMLGLDRSYKNFSPDERGKFLITPERMRAFDGISTTTNPKREKAAQKKGIVSEILYGNLVLADVLKKYPTLYLGSGTDIEYPLALGSREIIMVDYIFIDREAVDQIIEKVKDITGHEPEIKDDEIRFIFDFGEGEEEVIVKLIAKNYSPDQQAPEAFTSPEKIGMILTFVPLGPMGMIVTGDDLKSKVVPGGVILEDGYLTAFDGQAHGQERKLLGEKILD